MNHYTPLPSEAFAEDKSQSRLSPIVRLGSIDHLETALADSWLDVTRATYHFLTLLREFDMRQGWRAYGCNDCAEWLDFKLKIARKTALEKVRVANALWFVPEIEAAFRDGQLSYSQVRALTRVADQDNEASLLVYARQSTAEGLERYCRQLRCGDVSVSETQAKRALHSRALHVHVDSGEITVKLPAAELALVQQVLEQLVSELPEDPDRDYFAARADALVALARGRLSPEREGAQEGERKETVNDAYQVLVHIDAEALAGHGGKSDLPLPVVQRLCCDGGVVPILKRGDDVLSVGRKQRTVPTAIKRALAARDHSCRYPGCHHTQFLDAHHIQHWCDGGETALDNLVLLCSHHHRLIHEGGFRLKTAGLKPTGQRFYFARPDGRPVERPSSAEDAFAEDRERASSAEDLACKRSVRNPALE